MTKKKIIGLKTFATIILGHGMFFITCSQYK